MDKPVFKKNKIMVVDDEPYMVFLLKEIFIREGMDVITAMDGKECLEKIAADQPDIILLDIMMPDMTGYQVCQNIKSNPSTKGIPIIFTSVKNEEMDIVRAIEMGGSDYFTKPITNSIVVAKVKQILNETKNKNLFMKEIENLKETYSDLEEKYEKINIDKMDVGKERLNKLDIIGGNIPFIHESALIEYSQNDDLNKVIKSITKTLIRNERTVFLITSQPETNEFIEVFAKEINDNRIKLVDIISSDSVGKKEEKYIQIYLSEIIHYGILWNYIPDNSVLIFTPLSKILNKFGIRTTYNFLQRANETLSKKSSILITSINKNAHEKNLISGIETIFPTIFEIENQELKKII